MSFLTNKTLSKFNIYILESFITSPELKIFKEILEIDNIIKKPQIIKNLEDIEIEWINYSNFINEKEKRVNELLNNLKDKIEKVLLNDIFYVLESSDIKDISPENQEIIDEKIYEKLLLPGEIRILYSKK